MKDCSTESDIAEYLAALSYYLKSARKKNGLTQEELAAVNVDTRTIMNIENCKDNNPKFETLIKIFQFFKMDTNQVFFPNLQMKAPAITELEVALDGCSEEEIRLLIPICQCILDSVRSLQKISAI